MQWKNWEQILLTLDFGWSLRYREHVIRADKQIYVQGQVKNKDGRKTLGSEGGHPLIISDQGERGALNKYYLQVIGTIILFLAIAEFFVYEQHF